LSPGHSKSLSPGHNRVLSPKVTHQRSISDQNVPKSGTHKRGLSPGTQHNTGLSKASKGTTPKMGGKSTPKGKGNTGGMGKPKGKTTSKSITLRNSAIANTQRRIGPQMFRGGGTVGRR
jgi:hypothetical protein